MPTPSPHSVESFNALSTGHFPGLLGIEIIALTPSSVEMRMAVRPELFAPNGFLHAGAVVTLADTACGYGCMTQLPDGAEGFTTIELKSNHLGTAREGAIVCTATAAHLGRTTQVWDAVVRHEGTQRRMALFRCTQMLLYPKA